MGGVTFQGAWQNFLSIIISIITNAGHLINDFGRLGIGIINLILSIFGAKIPEIIIVANLNISTGLFFNVLVIGGAVFVIWKHFGKMFMDYIKIIGAGTGGLLGLSVIGAII